LDAFLLGKQLWTRERGRERAFAIFVGA